jgi:hypothetical protein
MTDSDIEMGDGEDDSMEDLDLASLGYRELQKACKKRGLPATGKAEVLVQQLQSFFADPTAAREEFASAKKKKKQQDNSGKGWINWRKSAAREILLEDLEPNGWLYGQEDLDVKIIFDIYKHTMDEFNDVPFDQFQARYNDSISKAAVRRARAAEEEAWLEHDRRLHPRKSHNQRGEPVFDLDQEAKKQLQEDIKNKLHKTMTPMELQSSRAIYMKYKPEKFRFRIYQEIRRVKFLNYLEKQRTKKRRQFAANHVKFERK